jgi:hypothetical protein
MPILAMTITTYHPDTGRAKSTTQQNPTWDAVCAELSNMDSYSKPLLTLEQNADDPSANVMMICGGSGTYHIQYADNEACWFQACDPDGSDEEIDVWTSDQGFATAKKNTWPIETALTLAKYYYEHGCAHLAFNWN